ncbi:MAG TPA: glycosyltransferase [Candidatus Eisenbacteria bacterium]
MRKLLFYSQHVLGMGHFVRAMELTRGLRDYRVRFLNGGESVAEFPHPPWVELVNLPPVKPDAELKYIQATDPSRNLEELKLSRREALLSEYEQFRPDVLVIELFPFGRRQFVFELLPLLARTRQRGQSTKVVCSVRDILVTHPEHVHHEQWVCELLNRYFDLVLVHSDPGFQTLQETFSRVKDVRTEIRYTGYVAQTPNGQPPETNGASVRPRQAGHPTIVVSVGGGRVGYDLLTSAVQASAILEASQPHRMLIFSGPFLPEAQFSELSRLVAGRPNIKLRRFTHHFLSHLEQADLSISLGGYNTCMNVLTTRCRALVLPFAPPGNEEQTIRANKLERLGLVNVIRPDELGPEALADKIRASLETEPTPYRLDTRGVEKSAALITALVDGQLDRPRGHKSRAPHTRGNVLGPSASELKARLEAFEREGRTIDIFLRNDDVGKEDRGLRRLLDLTLARGVPLSLEVIPGVLNGSKEMLLQEYKHFFPTLLELNQHGWEHRNHELNGTKSEFGANRSYAQQLEDIARGKRLLEQAFPDRFHAVFTPPWNRCTEDTLHALDQLGFRVLSRSRGHAEATGHRFREIPITLDLFRWKGGVVLRPSDEILADLMSQMNEGVTIGLMLHHQVMGPDAFAFLEDLLDELIRYPVVRFHTFRSLMSSIT